ncbi:SET domain-containing protein [Flavobacterium mesophilum]|uniref:SET domain-containing protein n=1 Tax=Flavobacterium mesophilum TaxID=3143495 RepID=UPI0031CEBF87
MKYEVDRSNLTNIKVIATLDILFEESIGIWVTDKPMSKKSRCLFQEQMSKTWWETEDLGRYCNHALIPNTTVVFHQNQLELITNKPIFCGEEILVDYRKITDYTGYIPIINF